MNWIIFILGYTETLQACRTKKNKEEERIPAYKKYRLLWLPDLDKLSVRNCLQWVKIRLTVVGLADGSFHYNPFPL